VTAGAAGVVLVLFFCPFLTWAAIIVLGFILFFFRDPKRDVPDNPQIWVAPADGRITDIDIAKYPGDNSISLRKIGIFLSVFDVHVQKYPCAGYVESVTYEKGAFHAAFLPAASRQNESNTVILRTSHGPVIIRQIAGLIARRIVCDAIPQKDVAKGDRLGIIMFGSRVEVYLPMAVDLIVRIGDRVKGSETVIGVIP